MRRITPHPRRQKILKPNKPQDGLVGALVGTTTTGDVALVGTGTGATTTTGTGTGTGTGMVTGTGTGTAAGMTTGAAAGAGARTVDS